LIFYLQIYEFSGFDEFFRIRIEGFEKKLRM
jgi:hypothetical protein